jgi:hypothetical protein
MVDLTSFPILVFQAHREFAYQAEPLPGSRYGLMAVEKFHDIITPAEMDCALKYKPISWFS